MPLSAATRLGPYEILGPLGAGGMGEVYRARDERLGRDVAIKVLPQRLALDQAALARFERETRAVAALSHPNILSIFDVGQEAGVAFAVTELLEGETLRDRLRNGPLPLRKALSFGAQIAQGLAAAHDKGIVHRDLKPENVFLTPDGRATILDFGLAKPASDTGDAFAATIVAQTDPGTVAGTPPYMSPEQVRGQAVTAQSDIFSFGAVLFEMLAGRRAFDRQSAVETMTAVLKEDPPDLVTLVAGIPPAVAALVRHCLEKQTTERFQSARDVAFHLIALAGTPTPSHAVVVEETLVQARSEVTDSGRLKSGGAGMTSTVRWTAMAVAAALAGCALFGGGWWLSRRPSSQPSFTRLSYKEKAIYRAAFVPEKDAVVYSAAVDDNRPVVLRIGREYPSSTSIGLPPGTHLLSVSKSGELALLMDARVVTAEILRGTLARMALGAQGARRLLDGVRDADWMPDGGELAIVRTVGSKDRLEFPPGKVVYETDGYLSDLHVSPDGASFAAFEHPMRWEPRASLVIIDRAGRKTVVAGEYGFARGVAWRPDGRELVFSASSHGAGNSSILAVVPGGKARLVLDAPGSLTVHDVSGAGEWLISRDERREGLRVAMKGDAAERELGWLDRSQAVALSHDGRTLLFTELAPPAGPGGSVCLRPTDGGPVVSMGSGVAHDLSSDGQWVLAVADGKRLQVYPVGMGEPRDLPRGAIESYRWATWFPNGLRILACGTEHGRPSRCYWQDVEGGDPRPATPDGEWGIVSPDGHRALTWHAEAAPVIYSLDGNPQPTAVPTATAADMPAGWSADGAAVLLYQPSQVPAEVVRVDLASGHRQVVRRLSPPDGVGVLSLDPVIVSPDGSSYAYTYTRVLSTLFTVTGLK
jgi:eukaryotic-like serine/threonine-protein kinase